MRCTRHGRACGEPPTIVQPPQSDERYLVNNLLGKGAFARVYSVVNIPNTSDAADAVSATHTAIAALRGEHGSLRPVANGGGRGGENAGYKEFALKVISKCRLGDTALGREALRNEVSIHRKLNHPAIVKLFSFWEDQYRIFLLMHMVRGPQLEHVVKSRGRLSEAEASVYAANIFEALSYLHANRIVHRDLKLANLLLSHDRSRAYLCDFGLSAHLDSLRDESSQSVCGTPNYVAPELITSSVMAKSSGKRLPREYMRDMAKEKAQVTETTVGYTTSADSWSMGVVLYTMLVGSGPFDSEDLTRTFRRIRAARFTFPIGLRLSPHAKSLIRSLLSEDHTKRPSADMALQHPFFTSHDVPKLSGQVLLRDVSQESGSGLDRPIRDSQISFSGRAQKDFRGDRNENVNAPIILTKRTRLNGANHRMEPRRWSGSYHQQNVRQSSENELSVVGDSSTSGERKDIVRGDRERPTRGVGTRMLTRTSHERSSSLSTSVKVGKPRSSSRCSSFNTSPQRSFEDSKRSGVSMSKRRSSLQKSDKRHDILNLSVTLSAALMRGRKILDEKLSGNAKVPNTEHFETVATRLEQNCKPPPLVRRWLDYTSKYGFATMMEDGRTSCCFNDGSIMFFVSDTTEVPDFAYISPRSARGGKEDANSDDDKQRPKDISKKACLCTLFADMMVDGGRGSMYDLPSACNVSFLKSDSESSESLPNKSPSAGDHKDVVHVREWARFRNFRAAAFRLSNYSLHVKFDVGEDRCDDFVFNPVEGTLFYREARDGVAWQCAIRSLGEFSSHSEYLHSQLTFCAQAISKFLE